MEAGTGESGPQDRASLISLQNGRCGLWAVPSLSIVVRQKWTKSLSPVQATAGIEKPSQAPLSSLLISSWPQHLIWCPVFTNPVATVSTAIFRHSNWLSPHALNKATVPTAANGDPPIPASILRDLWQCSGKGLGLNIFYYIRLLAILLPDYNEICPLLGKMIRSLAIFKSPNLGLYIKAWRKRGLCRLGWG